MNLPALPLVTTPLAPAPVELQKLVAWSGPRRVKTSRGMRDLRTAAATSEFWAAWRSQRGPMTAAGISVAMKDGAWQVCWWSAPGETPAGTVAVAPVPPVAAAAGQRWSAEQEAIFAWFKSGAGSLVVRARAGTGKTTTIKEAFQHAPEQEMCYVVFNKKNQREAQDKITDPRVEVKTLHSLGYSYIQEVWKGVKPDDFVEADRLVTVAGDQVPEEVATQIQKLVGFAKNTLIAPSLSDLRDLADARGIDCPGFDEPENGGWIVSKLCEVALKCIELTRTKDKAGRISFNDMVWLPVAMGWVRSRYDLVVVDEAQDMNVPQLVMARGACRPGGRVCVVGDDRQAIYGFRGAAQDGIENMKRTLGAAELGLTTTYRCPKSVVALAAVLVPDYRAADTAPDGIVDTRPEYEVVETAQVGDAVLSRMNAPLMPLCLQLIRKGVAARIEGRDVGKALAAIVKKLKAKSVPHFMEKLDSWAAKMKKRAGNSEHAQARIESINDQADTLRAVAEGCAGVGEIETRLRDLFQDTDAGSRPAVVLSSVHKAKGLEWDKVFLLKRTFQRKRPLGAKAATAAESKEEANIYYVALTRAKRHLVLAVEAKQPAPVKSTAEKQAEKN